MAKVKLNKGEAIVDDEDYQRIVAFGKWSVVSGYATNGSNSNRTFMHHLVIGFKAGFVVDHINHNRLDNRRANLRFVTFSENSHMRLKSRNNRSGYIGVCWDSGNQKWRATIHHNYQPYHLGLFLCKIEAAKAYNKKAIELYGDKANINPIPIE